jgi:PTH1 family peptidyl-tRNA hydrolase
VLDNFATRELPEVGRLCEQAADATELLVRDGLEPAQNVVHAWG